MPLLFHLLMGMVDLAVLLAVARRPSAEALLLGLNAAALLAALLAAILGDHFFAHIRYLACALFVHAPLLLAGLAILVRRRRAYARACVALAALLAAVGVDAYLVEPRWLELTRIEVRSDKLARPLRVAVVADLQTDVIGSYERAALARVMAERPDLILLAGDYLQEDDAAQRRRLGGELRARLGESGFGAPLGVFAVEGNIEANLDHFGWSEVFAGTAVTPVAATRHFDLDGLSLTTLSLADSASPWLQIEPAAGFHIVLGHIPDFALGEVQADLLVAGHTHGGQVRLPFVGPLVTFSRVPRAWAAGVTRLGGGRTLVVSRGVGHERGEAPRLRFLCRPQLVLIELKPGRS